MDLVLVAQGIARPRTDLGYAVQVGVDGVILSLRIQTRHHALETVGLDGWQLGRRIKVVPAATLLRLGPRHAEQALFFSTERGAECYDPAHRGRGAAGNR